MFEQSTRRFHPARPEFIVALLAILLGLAARLRGLDREALWWDEGTSIWAASVPWSELTWSKDFVLDYHPPLYYVVLSLWSDVAGSGVFSVRLLSALTGVLVVAMTYSLGRFSGGPRVGAIASVVIALSPMHVFFSQEARMYPLVSALGAALALVAVATLRALHSRPGASSRGRWLVVAWAVMVAVTAYTYYYAAALAIALTLVGAVTLRSHPGRQRLWIAASVLATIAWLPWLILLATRGAAAGAATIPIDERTPLVVHRLLFDTWLVFTQWFERPSVAPAIAAAVALLCVVGALAGPRATDDRTPLWASRLLAISSVLAIGSVLAIVWLRPFYFPRMMIFVLPIAAVLLGAGLARLVPRGYPGMAAAVLVIIGSSFQPLDSQLRHVRSAFSPDDYVRVISLARPHLMPGDLLIAGHVWQLGYVRAYAPAVDLTLLLDRSDPPSPRTIPPTPARTWVMSHASDQRWTGLKLEELHGTGRPSRYVDQFGDTRLRLFGGPEPLDTPLPPRGRFPGVAVLTWPEQPPSPPLSPGDGIEIATIWLALARTSVPYTVFAQAIGPDGRVWAQLDGPPLMGGRDTTEWEPGEVIVDRRRLQTKPESPAGAYFVQVGLYDAATGRRLAVTGSATDGDSVVVGGFSVER